MTVIAVSTRSGLVECEHHGHVVVVDSEGSIRFSVGEPELVTYPRSANKLLQAAALMQLGLELPSRLLALAASSHSGEAFHQEGARAILALAGKGERDLDNTPSLPYDPVEASEVLRGGGGPTRIAQNCSGKHAAMVVTCVHNGWPVDNYLDPDHPLQGAITAFMEKEIGGSVDHIGVDGCGAPAHAFAMLRLAEAYGRSRIAGSVTGAIAKAMLAHPEIVGGTRRDVTLLMHSLPGVLIKDGADGVMAAALPDGTGIALKVSDGAAQPRVAVLLGVLEMLGLDVDRARMAVPLPIYGHGVPVGEIRSTLR